MKNALDQSPELVRTSLAIGLDTSSGNPVDRTGGAYGAGLIKNFAVVTRGEAAGHDLWLDQDFLQSVTDQVNASGAGHKSRFTHPGLSSDGLGKFTGRTKDAELTGDVVRADKHFAKSAHRTPDGDLAGYLMDRAEEDPASFGASIVFERDREQEDGFISRNTSTDMASRGKFMSPDPGNVKNLPHARLKRLHAVDIVDDPAANPNGLFHRGSEIAAEAETLLAFTLGLSSERPDVEHLGIDPDRANQFISRFLERHGLTIVLKQSEASMADESKTGEEKPATAHTEPKTTETPVKEEPATTPAADTDPKPETPPAEPSESAGLSGGREECAKFLAAFGAKGAEWFAAGKSFDQAKDLYIAALKSQQAEQAKAFGEALGERDKTIAEMSKKLGRGEASPVQFQAEQTDEQRKRSALKNKVGSDGLAAFAASINVK